MNQFPIPNEKVIVANWKNNPATLAEAKTLYTAEIAAAQKYPDLKTVICPPVELVKELSEIDNKHLGSQDVFWQPDEDNYGVRYVLVGHSDRRYPAVGEGDSDEIINAKIRVALASKVVPILLVGEKNKDDNRELALTGQLSRGLAGLSSDELGRVLICYEPVWAISTNPDATPDTPSSTLEAIKIIGDFLSIHYTLSTIPYLYGGSVDSQNIISFLQHPEIFGVVVGGASLDVVEFGDVLGLASKLWNI